MGQKVSPKGLRVGIIEDWESFWFADDQNFSRLLKEDVELRKYLKNQLYKAGISKIKISRKANQIEIDLYTAKPGLIIGKGGKEVAAIREELIKKAGKQVQLNVHEEKNPETCAVLLAENVAQQLERRIGFRRVMKQIVSRTLRAGAKGVKVMVSGPARRLGNRPERKISRGACPAADVARKHRLRLCRSDDHLRQDRGQGLGLQGRCPAHQGKSQGEGSQWYWSQLKQNSGNTSAGGCAE